MTAGGNAKASGTGEPAAHGVAIALGEAGILIRGTPGAGKTELALEAIAFFAAKNRFSALVADDGVLLEARSSRLIARCPPALKNLVEVRGAGVRRVLAPHRTLDAVRLSLVVDLLPPPIDPALRWPEGEEAVAVLKGIPLPRLALPAGGADDPIVAAGGAATLWWVLTTAALTHGAAASEREVTRGDPRAEERHRGTS